MAGGLGSIAGTLQGLDPLTLAQALEAQQQQELAQRTQQATQAASQAQGQYEQAAAQPPPDLNMFAQLIPALLGNTASVLSQNPVYSERGQQEVQQSRSDLLKARAQNLQGLMQTAQAKAEAAQKAGDFEAEHKARATLDSIHQKYDTVKQNADRAADKEAAAAKQAGEMDLQRLRNQGQLDVQRLQNQGGMAKTAAAANMSTAGAMDFLKDSIITTANGVRILNASGMTPTDQTKAKRWASENGVKYGDPKTMDKLHNVEGARTNLQAMLNQAAEILPATPQERVLKAPGIAGSIAMQTNPTRSAWKTWRIQAIKQLTAIAGGMGSGLRINQAEIMQAVKNDIPTEYDTLPVATAKINNVLAMLDRNEDPYLSQDWRQPARVGNMTPQNAKADAMKAARTGDLTSLRSIVQANPRLNNDPELLKLIKGKKR
jgi:hypothetical protein